MIYTGPLDRYFDYSEGWLGWRTMCGLVSVARARIEARRVTGSFGESERSAEAFTARIPFVDAIA